MRDHARLLACAPFVLLSLAGPAQAALQFEVQVERRVEVVQGAAHAGPHEGRATLQVLLSAQCSSVTEDGSMTLDDFERRRRHRVDLAARTVHSGSLYAVAAFRDMEFANRTRLQAALEQAKVDGVMVAADNAHALSIPDGGAPLEQQAIGASQVFRAGGRELLRIEGGGPALAPDDAARFVRFLRYRFAGHPQALAWLGAQRRLPARIVYRTREAGGEVVQQLAFGKVRQVADAPCDVSAYRPAGPATPDAEAAPLEQVLAAAEGLALTPPEMDEALRSRAERAFDEGRPLEAMLALLELNLTSGTGIGRLTDAQKAMVEADPDTRRLLGSISVSDKALRGRAIATMQALLPKAGAGRPVLQVFLANHLKAAGRQQEALDLFLSALRQRPCLAGAYKDLGDLLYARFDTVNAWRSWDAGRRIAPLMPMFAPVRQFEERLAQRRPEYF